MFFNTAAVFRYACTVSMASVVVFLFLGLRLCFIPLYSMPCFVHYSVYFYSTVQQFSLTDEKLNYSNLSMFSVAYNALV